MLIIRHDLTQNTVFRGLDADVARGGSMPLVALEIWDDVSDGISADSVELRRPGFDRLTQLFPVVVQRFVDDRIQIFL